MRMIKTKNNHSFFLNFLHLVQHRLFSLFLVSSFVFTNLTATPLIEAVKEGDVGKVKELLQQGVDPNECEDWRRTPLYHAAIKGYEAIVDILLEAGADIKLKDSNLLGPLHCAAYNDKPRLIEKFLQCGVGINDQTKNSKSSALHIATNRNQLNTVVCLVKNGADINSRNADGFTSLLLALDRKRYAIAQYLLHKKADMYIPTHYLADVKDVPNSFWARRHHVLSDGMIVGITDHRSFVLWNDKGEVVKSIRSEMFVLDLAVSPDEKCFLTTYMGHMGNMGKKIKIWCRDGTLVQEFDCSSTVHEMPRFSRDGNKIIVRSSDTTIKVLHRYSGAIDTFDHDAAFENSFFLGSGEVVTIKGTAIRIHKNLKKVQDILCHTEKIKTIAELADESIILLNDQGTVYIWNRKWNLIKRFNACTVKEIFVSSLKNFFFMSYQDGGGALYNVCSKRSESLKAPHCIPYVAFSHNEESMLISMDCGKVLLYTTGINRITGVLEHGREYDDIKVGFSPNDQLIVTNHKSMCWLWDKDTCLGSFYHIYGGPLPEFTSDGQSLLYYEDDYLFLRHIQPKTTFDFAVESGNNEIITTLILKLIEQTDWYKARV